MTAIATGPNEVDGAPGHTHRVQLKGRTVGPLFTNDLEEVHLWVAEDYPGQRYSIVTTSNHVAVANGFGTFCARGVLTPASEDQARRLDFVRWQIRSLYSARLVGPWTVAEEGDYDALTVEERVLLDALLPDCHSVTGQK